METSDHVQQTSENRFANPVTEADILSKIEGAIPASTTTWAVKIRDSMLLNQQWQGAEIPLHLDNEQFNYWLSRFVVKVRNKNSEHYHIIVVLFFSVFVLVLQPYIHEKQMKDNCKVPVDISKDPLFAYFRDVFDSVLKELYQQGIGIYKKKAEVFMRFR